MSKIHKILLSFVLVCSFFIPAKGFIANAAEGNSGDFLAEEGMPLQGLMILLACLVQNIPNRSY